MTGRILVTGGCGFIGRHLCHLLVRRGWTLRVVDDLSTGDLQALPPGAEVHRGDVCDPTVLREAFAGVDAVVHLAAVSSVEACLNEREATKRINVQGTVNVLEHAGALPLVFTSSAAIYGEQAHLPIPETARPNPISPYALDKLAGEHQIRAAVAMGRSRAVILRPFNVFGPGQLRGSPYSGVLTRFSEVIAEGLRPKVNGDGEQLRDFIHVQDVARGLVAAVERAQAATEPGLATYNLCTGVGVKIGDLAHRMLQLAGRVGAPLIGPSRQGDIRESLGDPTLAKQELGIVPEVVFENGLATLMQDYGIRVVDRAVAETR